MQAAGPQRGPAPVKNDRLESWKEIAAYLNRTVRTVQRWEKLEGLPVHRLDHAKQGSVYAYRAELDAWSAGHQRGIEQIEPKQLPARRSAWPKMIVLAALTCVIAWAAYTVVPRSPRFQNIQLKPLDRAIPEAFPALSPDGQYLAV